MRTRTQICAYTHTQTHIFARVHNIMKVTIRRHARKGLCDPADRYAGGGENLIKTDLATSVGKDPCQIGEGKRWRRDPSVGSCFYVYTCKWGENKMRKKLMRIQCAVRG